MADNLGKSVSVSSGGQETYYLPGHPRYDALSLDFDSGNSGSANVDITIATYDENDVRQAKDDGDFGNMDNVASWTGEDVSSGDPSYTTPALARTVAVRVNEAGSTNGAEASIDLHSATDPNENADAFLNR